MTIVAGFHVDDGILLCSDTQYTGATKIFQQKLFPYTITGDSYVFALAGHEQNGKMAIDECQEAIAEMKPEERTLRTVKRALQKAVKPICDEYVLARPPNEQEYLGFELLVGCWIPRGGGHKLFSIGRNGAVIKNDEYECIGTGSYMGHYFIRPQFNHHMSMDAAMLLAAQVLRVAKSYDPNCGGPSQFVVIGKNTRHVFIPYDFHWADNFLRTYEVHTASLMSSITDRHLSESDFDIALKVFVANMQNLRKVSATPLYPEALLNSQPTTSDPSHQRPSQESHGESGGF